jgi:hypothetical protein
MTNLLIVQENRNPEELVKSPDFQMLTTNSSFLKTIGSHKTSLQGAFVCRP